MSRDLDAVLASIDGALADEEFPDAMRWSPEPEAVDDARAPFDGETVWVGPEERSSTYDETLDYDPALPISTRNFPLIPTRRGGIRFPRPPAGVIPRGMMPDLLILDDPIPWTEPASDPLGDVLRAAERRSSTWRPAPIGRVTRIEETEEGLAAGGTLDLGLGDPFAHARARCSILPVFPDADVYLVDPAHRAEVLAARREEALRVFAQLGEVVQQIADTFVTTAEQIGKALAALAPRPEPPRSLREADPRAYALQLRQSRGTGPDRQLQRQHRPRRVS